jgi:glycosyltransferase involved in cell wall biosynthesis
MPTFFILWLVFCGLIALLWASRHLEINRSKRETRLLTSTSHPPVQVPAPRLSVLVAGKDEEATIESCIRSLVAQDYPNLEVIAINDRSADRTAEIMEALAAEFPDKLTVRHVEHLPEGWFGKNYAMHLGMKEATGDWLCFVDADCRQTSTASLSAAMQEARSVGVDFLSVLPVLETMSFWERVIQPVCSAIMVLWFNPKKVNDPKKRAAYANGAFMLMNRATYDEIGGHAAVKGIVNEDMRLAENTKHSGRRLFVIQNEDLYVTRMYSSLAEAWRGWSRIFCGCFRSTQRIFIALAVLLVASFYPFVSLAAALLGMAVTDGATESHFRWLVAASVVLVALLESVIFRFMKLAQSAPWAWTTYVLGVVIGIGILCSALWRHWRGTIAWRGTVYKHRKLAGDRGEVTAPRADEIAMPATKSDAAGRTAGDVA